MFRIRDSTSSQNLMKNTQTLTKMKNSFNIRNSKKNYYEKGKKLFSLLDIDDKKTNSKGTSLPFQFKRLTPNELEAVLKGTITSGNYIKKKSMTIETEDYNKKSRNSPHVNKALLNPDNISQTEPSSKRNFHYSKNDKWKPICFNKYEYLLHHPELIVTETANHKFSSSLPKISLKEIREKSHLSDIFFIKKDNKYPHAPNNEIVKAQYPNHMESDIFNLKDPQITKDKSGETYLYRPPKKEAYTTSNESGSQWHVKNNGMPTLTNHTSVNWNLLNPGNKSISKTKEEIEACCKGAISSFNPIYRQKGLSEFIDLTRVGAPNPNKPFIESMSRTYNCFRKRSDICSTYNDIHRMYRDLCDRPFVKPSLI